jgi:hypothetical protein
MEGIIGPLPYTPAKAGCEFCIEALNREFD